MNPNITLGDPYGVASKDRKRTHTRRPLPPLETRDWMTPNEAGLALVRILDDGDSCSELMSITILNSCR
jgi:hypothetical protein